MSLATTNLEISDILTVLGETSYTAKALYESSNINQWSWVKPSLYYSGIGSYEAKQIFLPTVGMPNSEEDYRFGDFRGYNHDAKEPLHWKDGSSLSYSVAPDEPYLQDVAPVIERGDMPITAFLDGYSPASFYIYDSGYKEKTSNGGTSTFDGIGISLRDGFVGVENTIKALTSLQVTPGADITPNPLNFETLGTHTLYAKAYVDDGDYSPLYDLSDTIEVTLTSNGTANWTITSTIYTSLDGESPGDARIEWSVSGVAGRYIDIDFNLLSGYNLAFSYFVESGNPTSKTINVTNGSSGTLYIFYNTSNSSAGILEYEIVNTRSGFEYKHQTRGCAAYQGT